MVIAADKFMLIVIRSEKLWWWLISKL